jgi:Fe-S-cluster-containing hydrogenase component 2
MVCSAQHEKVINPFQSRVKIIKWERDGEGFPTVCAQCLDAPCMDICPVKAISRDEALGRTRIDYEKCIGCRMCVAACPFGLVHFDTISRRVLKCDLCDGDPICARFCPYEALQYVDEAELGTPKRRGAAEKLREIMHQGVSAIPK